MGRKGLQWPSMLMPPQALEALLFVAAEPLTKDEISRLLEVSPANLEKVVTSLAKELSGRGLTLVDTGKELELRTAPDAAPILKKLYDSKLSRDLGKAGLETLAVVAYRPGSTRSEIDWVRGVNSSASMRTLLVRGLIAGEEDHNDRRKIRYRLTTEAYAHLGISTAEDLPRYSELSNGAQDATLTVEPES